MATDLTPTAIPAQTQSVPVGTSVAIQNGDATGNTFTLTGKEFLVLWNNGGSTRAVTVTRTTLNGAGLDDLTFNMLTQEWKILPFFPVDGHASPTTGKITITPAHADVKFILGRLPA